LPLSGPAKRAELQALLINCNTVCKLVWRAGIVLATSNGGFTFEIMRRLSSTSRLTPPTGLNNNASSSASVIAEGMGQMS